MIRTNLSTRALHRGTSMRSMAVPQWVALKEQAAIIGLGLLFLFGVAIGSCVVAWLDADATNNLMVILSGFVGARGAQELSQTFLSALTPNLMLLGILLLCGFCAVSAPIILLIPCFKGMGFGLMAAAMLSTQGTGAIAYLAAFVLPNMTASAIVVLLCCRDAMRLSISFWRSMSPEHRAAPSILPGNFAARWILYVLLAASGAVVEAYSYQLFGRFFSF